MEYREQGIYIPENFISSQASFKDYLYSLLGIMRIALVIVYCFGCICAALATQFNTHYAYLFLAIIGFLVSLQIFLILLLNKWRWQEKFKYFIVNTVTIHLIIQELLVLKHFFFQTASIDTAFCIIMLTFGIICAFIESELSLYVTIGTRGGK